MTREEDAVFDALGRLVDAAVAESERLPARAPWRNVLAVAELGNHLRRQLLEEARARDRAEGAHAAP